MAKIKFTFKLPEEEDDARTAMDGAKWRALVWDVKQELRNKIKHGDLTEAEYAAYEHISNIIGDGMAEHGLIFD